MSRPYLEQLKIQPFCAGMRSSMHGIDRYFYHLFIFNELLCYFLVFSTEYFVLTLYSISVLDWELVCALKDLIVFAFLFTLQLVGKDLLVVISDSGKLSILSYCNEMNRFFLLILIILSVETPLHAVQQICFLYAYVIFSSSIFYFIFLVF